MDEKDEGRYPRESNLKLSPQVADWGRWRKVQQSEGAANAKAWRCETLGDAFYNSDRMGALGIKE